MQAIETVTVGSGGAASITFDSIPDTYTDLVILCSLRTTATGNPSAEIFFNGVTTNRSERSLEGTGSGTNSFSTSQGFFGVINPNNATANTFSSHEIYIPNYAASAAKSYSVDSVSENNATAAYQYTVAGLWNSTAAINEITIRRHPGTHDLMEHSTATLYGIKSTAGSGAPKATGGMISYDAANNKWVHVFTASGTFTPTEDLTCDYLVIAGGAGGGLGGGGAGGYRTSAGTSGGGASAESALSLTNATGYTVTIGAGGAGAVNGSLAKSSNGINSVFFTITSDGGGGAGTGGTGGAFNAGADGGSGGGGHNGAAAGAGTTNQGYAGGVAGAGGGGGGASQSGGTASYPNGGNGGNGVLSSITGSAVSRAGGGGGWTAAGTAGTASAGGGAGGDNTSTAGTVNTGGGGGGGRAGTTGGSGVVIIRYGA
jgi:hypothetical protein